MENSRNLDKSKNECPKRSRAMQYFKEYCDYTGIHGFRYIAEDRPLYERIWWIVSLTLSIIFSGLMIHQIFQKYLNFPVIVTFSMQETHMNDIPFPAVTICPRAKISQEYFNISDAIIRKINNESFSGEAERLYNIASTICDFYGTEDSNENTTSDDLYDFLNLSRTDIFEYCAYTAQGFNCPTHFTQILTEDGVCYSFNILDKEDIYRDDVYSVPGYHDKHGKSQWDMENGYHASANRINVRPFRALRSGARNGLFVVLKTKISDIEYDCASDETGFRVAIHLPSKIPEVVESYFTLPLNQRVTGQIFPHIIKTSAGVKMFDPIKRDCYFQSEKKLKYFKIYSQENCLIECKTNFTLEACGCVGFYMPRYDDTPVCILDEVDCMEFAEGNFTIRNIKLPVRDNAGKQMTANCDCLPSCTDLTYSLQISQNSFVYRPRDVDYQLDDRYLYSILNLYFMRNHIETKERNELYGFSDFVSNFGGLLGLFTGFSMLSFIEIIYFLSIRMWGNMKMYRNWSGKNK